MANAEYLAELVRAHYAGEAKRFSNLLNQVIASEELESLVSCLSGVSGVLSDLESRVLSLYLDGHSYEAIAERLECDTKTVDNALQRIKRKVGIHLASREVAA